MSRFFLRGLFFRATGYECGFAPDLFHRSHVAEAGHFFFFFRSLLCCVLFHLFLFLISFFSECFTFGVSRRRLYCDRCWIPGGSANVRQSINRSINYSSRAAFQEQSTLNITRARYVDPHDTGNLGDECRANFETTPVSAVGAWALPHDPWVAPVVVQLHAHPRSWGSLRSLRTWPAVRAR